jgi:outer membrane lipoprotein-sorting protein|tara:strand:- start:1677 stop:2261 length:585 start_codon:yes stop_codon:yes gene_type:complete
MLFKVVLKLIFIIIFSFNVLASDEDLSKLIEFNWNQIKTLSGEFTQTSSGKQILKGEFFLNKPYKSFFKYNDEINNIITTRFFINIIDKNHNLIDRYPIINQPIYKILSNKVAFDDDFKILSISKIKGEVIIQLGLNNNAEARSHITVTFDGVDYSLKKWEIVDQFGKSTLLEFTKLRKNISIEADLFSVQEEN